MDRLARRRVELAKPLVRRVRILVVEAFETGASRGRSCRRDVQVDERRTEVQTRPACDDSAPPGRHEVVDLGLRKRCILAHGHRLGHVADGDETGAPGGLVRQDRQAAIHLKRVGGDDLGADAIGESLRDLGLAGSRRAEDRDDLVAHFGHAPWGTPAHHPLRS